MASLIFFNIVFEKQGPFLKIQFILKPLCCQLTSIMYFGFHSTSNSAVVSTTVLLMKDGVKLKWTLPRDR